MTVHCISCNMFARGMSFTMVHQSISELRIVISLKFVCLKHELISRSAERVIYYSLSLDHLNFKVESTVTAVMFSSEFKSWRCVYLRYYFFPSPHQISGIFLTKKVQWVGCQGSRPELRGYTCSLWKLFHTLTVQAALRPKALINTGKQQLCETLEG